MERSNLQRRVDEGEITFEYIRSSGPGGQNVNKVATAVQLRWNINCASSLPQEIKERLRTLAGRRMAADGTLIMLARRFRTQERNRQDVLERLNALLEKAARPAPLRHPTRPTLASRENRLQEKKSKSQTKSNRRKFSGEAD
jgi:ribosome-associated protein